MDTAAAAAAAAAANVLAKAAAEAIDKIGAAAMVNGVLGADQPAAAAAAAGAAAAAVTAEAAGIESAGVTVHIAAPAEAAVMTEMAAATVAAAAKSTTRHHHHSNTSLYFQLRYGYFECCELHLIEIPTELFCYKEFFSVAFSAKYGFRVLILKTGMLARCPIWRQQRRASQEGREQNWPAKFWA